jgi:putative tricarboxylic transport membrane protein
MTERGPFWSSKGSWKPVLFTTLGLIAYVLVLKPIGFILTTFLFVFYLMKFICKKRWSISIGTGVIFSLVSYGLFAYLLGTPLPKGYLYGRIIGYMGWV